MQEIPDKVHGSHIHNHQSDNAPVHVDSITVQHDKRQLRPFSLGFSAECSHLSLCPAYVANYNHILSSDCLMGSLQGESRQDCAGLDSHYLQEEVHF